MAGLLNPRQRRFVDAIIAGDSQEVAYRKAGYSSNGAKANGHRLTTHDGVSRAIQEAQARIAQAAELTADDIIARLDRAYEAALAAVPIQANAAVSAALGMAKVAGLVIDRSEATVLHKPAPVSGAAIELSPEEWKRQFAPKGSPSEH